MLNPSVVGVPGGRESVFPARVVFEFSLIPRVLIERRIGEYEIGFQSRVQVVCERVGMIGAEIGVDPADCHIHFCHFSRVGVCLLSVNGDCAAPAGMRPDELCALHEHAARSAAAIVDAAIIEGPEN